jgi:hypothetical protein
VVQQLLHLLGHIAQQLHKQVGMAAGDDGSGSVQTETAQGHARHSLTKLQIKKRNHGHSIHQPTISVSDALLPPPPVCDALRAAPCWLVRALP